MRGGSTASWRARSPGRAAASTRPACWTWGAGPGPSPKSSSTRSPGLRPRGGRRFRRTWPSMVAERLGGRAEVVVGDAERPALSAIILLLRRTATTRATITADPSAGRRSRCGCALRPGGTLVVELTYVQPAPARAVHDSRGCRHSAEGDVRIYSDGEMREILAHAVRQRELAADRPHLLRWQSRETAWPLHVSCMATTRRHPPLEWKPVPSRVESAENYLRAMPGVSALRMGDAATSTSRGTWASRGRASPRPS